MVNHGKPCLTHNWIIAGNCWINYDDSRYDHDLTSRRHWNDDDDDDDD